MKFLRVKEAMPISVTSPSAVAQAMRDESQIDREAFFVLHLNTRNRVIEKEMVSLGVLDSSLVHPREVFKKAIVNGAASLISVHNLCDASHKLCYVQLPVMCRSPPFPTVLTQSQVKFASHNHNCDHQFKIPLSRRMEESGGRTIPLAGRFDPTRGPSAGEINA